MKRTIKNNPAIDCVNDILATNTKAHLLIALDQYEHVAVQLEDDDEPIISEVIASAMLKHNSVRDAIFQAVAIHAVNTGGAIPIQLPKDPSLN